MMQATKNRLHYNLHVWWKLVPVHMESNWQVRWRLWDARTQGHMRTPGVIMHDPLVQDTLQMLGCQRNEKIYALTSQRAQEPLAEGIRPRAVRRGFEYREA